MYPLLRKGDRLPPVAIVQILLNRHLERGSYIAVDGSYGRNTREAVIDFQRRKSLHADGVVGRNTWTTLIRGQRLRVVDSVDVTKPGDMGYDAAAVRSAGGQPIVNFGMCNGVNAVLSEILSQAPHGKVVLLRFHGHGAPGVMNLSAGTDSELSSSFGVTFLDNLARYLQRLSPIFSPLGSAELHGCRVGAGRDGRRLVTALAWAWRVPVTAGVRSQYGGGHTTFRFEGPTFTAFPNGGGLQGWARSLPVPEIHGMTVAR